MTGCGCAILIAIIVGLIAFFLFGSTDPGEPVENAVVLLGLGMLVVPLRLALVRARGAK